MKKIIKLQLKGVDFMKVHKLTVDNHKEIVELFGENIGDYCFIIDDLLRNKYEGEGFHVYGEYENDKLVSILLNNFINITYYSNEDRPVEVYKDIVKKLNFMKLSGPGSLIEKFIPYVEVKEDTLSYMGVIKNISVEKRYRDLSVNVINSEEEFGMLHELLMTSEEYWGCIPEDKGEFIKNNMINNRNNKRTAYLSVDYEMVSSCSTIIEGEKSAIIAGVVTNPKYRNLGYGTETLIGLFEMLLKEGKYPYLFYNNPAARSVYKKMGMKEVCEWRVIWVQQNIER